MGHKGFSTLTRRLLLFLITFSLLISFNAPAQAERQNFLFGSAIALTGKFAREGTNMKKAFDFWASAINAKGGIEVKGKRYPVKIIYYDDKSDPKTTTKLVEKLITVDKVDGIFGPFSSLCVGPSSTIAEKYKVPMIEAAGNARGLFKRGFKYLFCTLRPADELADPYFRMFKAMPNPPKTVAIISPKSPFYMSAAKGFKAYAKKYGLDVVHYEVYPREMQDITAVLQKVKSKNPDILAVGSHTVVAMSVMNQSKQIDFNPKAFIFSYGTLTPGFAKELGQDAEYIFEYGYLSSKAPFKDSLLGTSAQFIADFKKKYGAVPDATQSQAVAAGIAFQVAIQNAGVTPPLGVKKREKMRNALAKLDIQTAAGPVKFDATGLNMANPLCIFQIQNGIPVCVDPPQWAEKKVVYPAPEWKKR